MPDIKKIANTVRYLTFRQWKYRVYYTVRNKLIKRQLYSPSNVGNVRLLTLNYKNNLEKRESVERANLILNNSFITVSGIIKSFAEEIDWDLKDESYRLICFRLNSFKYLLDLSDAYKLTGDNKYIDKGFALIENWWKSNSICIKGDKWNPYVIADRIMNWIGFCSEYCITSDRGIDKFATWIYQQAIELRKSVEYQLGANHLLSEGKALLVAGVFLKNEKLYAYGKKVLKEEYSEQFLPDGGHYERSVSYHIESLQQYFESLAVMINIDDGDARCFARMIKPAYQYLYGMIGVNGEIPLFNDSARDYPFENAVEFVSTADLIYCTSPPIICEGEYYRRWNWFVHQKEIIEWINQEYYLDSGYIHHQFYVKDEKYSLYFDVGNGGPDYNLGHAHADALSVLLKNCNKEILTDSGVFTYKQGTERNACRSTKAHNTIEVDEKNSSEIWSAFRVAKRSHSKVYSCSCEGGELLICASHDGYSKCLDSPVWHERTLKECGGCIQIDDKLCGKSKHNAKSRFHIGEQCKIEFINDRECIIDNTITFKCSIPMELVESESAEYFGVKKRTKCIEIPFTFSNEILIKTTICINNSEEEKND